MNQLSIKTRLLAAGCAVACLAALPAASCAQERSFSSRIWLGGPLLYEIQPASNRAFSFGAGIGPVVVKSTSYDYYGETTSSDIKLGLAIESLYYPNKSGWGLAGGLRFGSAGGATYIAPGVFYVSRPKHNVCGRVGVLFPLGGSVDAFLPELAIGWSF